MKKYDVIIVGAGIGGSTAAHFMGKAGLNVLLLEKEQFPRDKVCGDGQVEGLLPLFEEMGILEEFKKYAHACNGCRFSDIDENMAAFRGSLTYVTPRYIFDDIVNKSAVKQDIDYIENFEATEVVMARNQAKGVRGIHNGKMVEFEGNIIVLANGSHSMLSRQMGFYEEDPEYVFYGMRGYFENVGGMDPSLSELHYPRKEFTLGSYMWVFPMSETKANIGVFLTEQALRSLGMTQEEVMWWWRDNTKIGQERLGKAKLIGELKGWRLPTGMRQKKHAAGVIAIGDAANMIEQLYGGGIPYAMRAGKAAASFCSEAIAERDFSEASMKRFSDMLDKEFGPEYKGLDTMRGLLFKDPQDMKDFIAFAKDITDPTLSEEEIMMMYLEKKGVTGLSNSIYA